MSFAAVALCHPVILGIEVQDLSPSCAALALKQA